MKRLTLSLLLLLAAACAPRSQPAHAHPSPTRVQLRLYPVMHTKPRISSHVVKLSSVLHGIRTGDGDLTAWAPAVRNQGSNGSCVTFATTTVRAEIAYHDQGVTFDAAGLAPMFQYSQLVTSPDEGTTFEDNLKIEEIQGAEPSAQYSYGEQAALTDWHDQVTPQDVQRAAPWKIANYSLIYDQGQGAPGEQADPVAVASQALHDGYAVLLGIKVYDPFMYYSGQGQVAAGGVTLFGYHAIAAFRANADGSLSIENSWGPGWGQSGWATLSPDFIRQDVFAEYIVFGPHVSPRPTPVPTDTPTPLPTSTPTATPLPTATATPAPAPTSTATAAPTATSAPTMTATAVPAPTQTPTPKPRKHRKPKHYGPRGGFHGTTWL